MLMSFRKYGYIWNNNLNLSSLKVFKMLEFKMT